MFTRQSWLQHRFINARLASRSVSSPKRLEGTAGGQIHYRHYRIPNGFELILERVGLRRMLHKINSFILLHSFKFKQLNYHSGKRWLILWKQKSHWDMVTTTRTGWNSLTWAEQLFEVSSGTSAEELGSTFSKDLLNFFLRKENREATPMNRKRLASFLQ